MKRLHKMFCRRRNRIIFIVLFVQSLLIIYHVLNDSISGSKLYEEPIDQRLLPFSIYHSKVECDCSKRRAVFVIHSSVQNDHRRDVIRRTYGSVENQKEYGFCLFFFSGRQPQSTVEEGKLIDESNQYKDIVVGDYIDSYTNMTIKALFWLRFVHEHCYSTINVVKMDDDVQINLRALVNRLHSLSPYSIHGVKWTKQPVRRNLTSKWYVSYSSWPFINFPPYVSGSAYIISTDAVKSILGRMPYHPRYLHIDDVYVTGILANSAGVKIIDRAKWWNFKENSTELIEGKVIFSLFLPNDDPISIWKKVNSLTKHSIAEYTQD